MCHPPPAYGLGLILLILQIRKWTLRWKNLPQPQSSLVVEPLADAPCIPLNLLRYVLSLTCMPTVCYTGCFTWFHLGDLVVAIFSVIGMTVWAHASRGGALTAASAELSASLSPLNYFSRAC